MNQLGVTVEYLSSTVSREASAVEKAIVGKKPASSKRASKGAARYQDSQTGATWSGFSRAPDWIAGAKNRDAFLVDKSGAKAPEEGPVAKKRSAVKASAKKATKTAAETAASVAKKVTRKVAGPAGAKWKPPAKKASAKAAANRPARRARHTVGDLSSRPWHPAGAYGAGRRPLLRCSMRVPFRPEPMRRGSAMLGEARHLV